MPETVFFKDGKVDFITAIDKEGCLVLDTKTKLDSMLAIRKKISEIMRERRKDEELFSKEQALVDAKEKLTN